MRKIGRAFVWALALVLLIAVPFLASSATPTRVHRSGGRSQGSPRLAVLGYHAVADHSDDPVLADFSVPPERFAEHLDTLAERGWRFVGLDALLASLDGGEALPDRALLLTFDDAYADLLRACPLLEERGIPAVAFAVADHVGGVNAWDHQHGAGSVELLDAAGLHELAARGIEIGSHTATHPALPELEDGRLEAELSGSADCLEALGLPRPRAFSYPYGLWSPAVAEAVRQAGYELAFAVERGTVGEGANRFALPRVAVHAGDSGRRLHYKLATADVRKRVRDLIRRFV